MNNPIFSIIIPTFNAAKTLDACLKSVLNQTFTNFEVLIMDGVSNDGTLTIANSFKDVRTRIYSESDKGIYDAMNKGIELAKGTWLYFLGSDDELFDADVLENISIELINSSNKIVYGNVMITGDSDWAKNGEVYDGKFDREKLFRKNICHQGIFYQKNIFKIVGKFNVRYKALADWEHNLKWFGNSKINHFYTNQIIAKFTVGGFSSTYNDSLFYDLKEWLNIIYNKNSLTRKDRLIVMVKLLHQAFLNKDARKISRVILDSPKFLF